MFKSQSKKSDDFEDKKAYPELLLKQQIAITDRGKVISAFKELEKNRKCNPGMVVDKDDKVIFESEIAGLFLDIKDMIKAKVSFNNMSDNDKIIYRNLMGLVNGKSYCVDELIKMMIYLFRMLHILNITNLLINQPDAFADWESEL